MDKYLPLEKVTKTPRDVIIILKMTDSLLIYCDLGQSVYYFMQFIIYNIYFSFISIIP